MKKYLCICVAGMLFLLVASGCSQKEEKAVPEETVSMENEDTAESGTEDTKETEGTKTDKTEEAEDEVENGETSGISIPSCDFVFASGAGAWGTFLALDADGSFTGGYNDSDMGDSGEGYPHGKHYYCEFQGRFGDFAQIDENTVSMTLEELAFQPEEGFEEIRDEILHVGAKPLGLDSGTEFVLYLPETSAADLPEEFLSWWPGRYEWDGETERQLGCYGILNQETGAGFFSDAVCTACGAVAVSPQTGECGKCGAVQ